jgi:predicted ATPase
MADTIKKLTIEGFKSIRKLEDFELRSLNVLIGANGAGKSNFVGFFRLLRELLDQRLELAVRLEGGADRCLYMGPKVTQRLVAKLHFGPYRYEFALVPTVDNRLVFEREGVGSKAYYKGDLLTTDVSLGSGHAERKFPWEGKAVRLRDLRSLGLGHAESKFKEELAVAGTPEYDALAAVSSWVVYHFHDTSPTAGVRRQGPINDNEFLRPNAENLAAFLYRVRETNPTNYAKIRDLVRLAAPFFDDFKLRPVPTDPEMIQLEWLQKESDYPFLASHLSDGTLRFICMATALLQPSLPPTVLFDEPELGLHPFALTLLANLFQQAAKQYGTWVSQQLIVSTQSAPLLNHFAPEDVIVVERAEGQSTFRRLESAHLSEWLAEYTLGELWQKNVLGGRPQSEEARRPSDGSSVPSQAPHPDEPTTEDHRP